jgi:hypothetical protein
LLNNWRPNPSDSSLPSIDYPEPPPTLGCRFRRLARRNRKRGVQQLANRPNVIRDPERRRWRVLMPHIWRQRFVDAAEIVVRDLKAQSRQMLVQLLAESVKRRDAMRTLRFERSTCEVQISAAYPAFRFFGFLSFSASLVRSRNDQLTRKRAK